jgi:ABC-type transport system involved in multi-copper enzyme maturation permease subunit
MVNVVTDIGKKELRTRFGSKSVVLPILLAMGLPLLVFIPQLLKTMNQAEPGSEYISLMFFLVFPVMITTLVGIHTFINEIRWKTIKSILVAPISEGEIFLGKSMACIVVGLLVEAFLSMIVLIFVDDVTISILLLIFLIGPLSVIFTTFIFILGTLRFPAIAENGGAVLMPIGGLLIIFLISIFLKEFLVIDPTLHGVMLSLIITIFTGGAYYISKKWFNRERLVLSV